jgi:hypothetical protein
MLRKSNPTSNPARFSVKSFQSLLEAVAATGQPAEKKKETKPAIRGGGGFKGSESESKEGYGGRRPEKYSEGSSFLYTAGLPLAFMRGGLGMQQVDYALSKLPFGSGQVAGAAIVGSALPELLSAFDSDAAKSASAITPEIEVEDIPPEYRDEVRRALGFDTENNNSNTSTSPVSRTAKTITVGGREMSVKPDSLMGKLADPYGIGPFVDFAKGISQGKRNAEARKKYEGSRYSL